MATNKRRSTRDMTWVRVLTQRDLEELRSLLEKTDKKRAEWHYKLHRDNIIISVPVRLEYQETQATCSLATKREAAVKVMS
jgi:hypothetical protein